MAVQSSTLATANRPYEADREAERAKQTQIATRSSRSRRGLLTFEGPDAAPGPRDLMVPRQLGQVPDIAVGIRTLTPRAAFAARGARLPEPARRRQTEPNELS